MGSGNREVEILHVAPHLGGGIGRVLLNYLAAAGPDSGQRLFCLDHASPDAWTRAEAEGLHLRDRLGRDHRALGEAAAAADLVVVHWWNHPLMYAWLCSGPWPPARMLLWSHVSGLAAPQVLTDELAAFPDILALASPVGFRAPAVAALSEADRAERLRLVFSTAGLDHPGEARPRPHRGFRVGYLGPMDYTRLHPDFIDLCLAAEEPGTVFALAGGPGDDSLRTEVRNRGLAKLFEISGPIAGGFDFLAGLDVFGYPVNPDHYGTDEQALIEAQAAGVPAVVLAGGAGEFLIEDGVTGLVARNTDDYALCLRRLQNDEDLRRRLGEAARHRARERFGMDGLTAAFDALYGELLARPKRSRVWPGLETREPWRIFLASQGQAADFFETLDRSPRPDPGRLLQAGLSASRGSVFHYAAFFPEDERLRRWSEKLSGSGPTAPTGGSGRRMKG